MRNSGFASLYGDVGVSVTAGKGIRRCQCP